MTYEHQKLSKKLCPMLLLFPGKVKASRMINKKRLFARHNVQVKLTDKCIFS